MLLLATIHKAVQTDRQTDTSRLSAIGMGHLYISIDGLKVYYKDGILVFRFD